MGFYRWERLQQKSNVGNTGAHLLPRSVPIGVQESAALRPMTRQFGRARLTRDYQSCQIRQLSLRVVFSGSCRWRQRWTCVMRSLPRCARSSAVPAIFSSGGPITSVAPLNKAVTASGPEALKTERSKLRYSVCCLHIESVLLRQRHVDSTAMLHSNALGPAGRSRCIDDISVAFRSQHG